MVFPVVGGSQQVATYDIANSLRFDGSTSYINLSTGTTNKRKFTVSLWAKRSNNGARQSLWASDKTTNDTGDGSKGGSGIALQFWNDNQFYFGGFGGSFQVRANGLQRDNAAWYHIVGQVDTEQGTTNDRAKLWINGVQQTTYTSMIGQNTDVKFATNLIGRQSSTANYSDSDSYMYYTDGYIAELHVIDGQYYDASYFGETNANGVWVPKEYEGSYGSDGYYLEFKQTGTSQNASGIGADTSGNTNHFAVSGVNAKDVCIDTPTNNFMTMNPLTTNSRGTFAEGSLMVTTDVQGSDPYGQVEFGTFAVNKGKWYYEAKINSVGSGGVLGIGWNERWEDGNYTNGHNNGGSSGNVMYRSGGTIQIGSSHTQSTGVDSFTNNDIVGVAIDLDNDKVYFTKNGAYQDDPTPDPDDNDGRAVVSAYNNYWTPWMSKDDTNYESTVEFNFGNPTFTVSSTQADDNGYGSFEYDVPTGYYSLCTKNLAEFG